MPSICITNHHNVEYSNNVPFFGKGINLPTPMSDRDIVQEKKSEINCNKKSEIKVNFNLRLVN